MKKTVLKNGITIITKHIPNSNAVSIGFWIKSGSINETQKESGYAHFLEHMIFKGTKKRTPQQIAQEIDYAGAYINAATSKEYTVYYINIIDSKINLALNILTDIIDQSIFKQSEIKKEKQVILEEIKMYEDTPSEFVQDNLNEAMLYGNPIGNPILGQKKIIKKATRKKLLKYYNNNYYSSNIIISAAGNIKHDKIKNYVLKTKFFNKKNKPEEHKKIIDSPIKTKNIILTKDLAQVHICMGFPCIPITDKLRYAIYILNATFGSSMSSRLFQKIRESMGLCYSIFSFSSLYKNTGFFGIYTGMGIQSFKKTVKAILKEIKKIKKHKLNQKEINNAKEHLKGNLALSYENINTHMNSLARHEIYYNKQFTFKEISRNIDKVCKDEIEQVINLIFPDDYKIIISSIGNQKHKKILNQIDLVI